MISLTWVFPPPPEPDKRGEIPWLIAQPDGSELLGRKHVATGVIRAITVDEFWRYAVEDAEERDMTLPTNPIPTNKQVFEQALQTVNLKYHDGLAHISMLEAEVARLRQLLVDETAARADQGRVIDEFYNYVWGLLYPEHPTSWEYPGQIHTHLAAAFLLLKHNEAEARRLLMAAWERADFEYFLDANGKVNVADKTVAEIFAFLWPHGRQRKENLE